MGLAQAHPPTKPLAMRGQPSAGLGPVTVHPTHPRKFLYMLVLSVAHASFLNFMRAWNEWHLTLKSCRSAIRSCAGWHDHRGRCCDSGLSRICWFKTLSKSSHHEYLAGPDFGGWLTTLAWTWCAARCRLIFRKTSRARCCCCPVYIIHGPPGRERELASCQHR